MDVGQIKEIGFGAHIPLERTITRTVSKWTDLSVVQFFIANPRTYGLGHHSIEDIKSASKVALSENVSVLIHAPYVVRVGGGERSDKFLRDIYDKYSGVDMFSLVSHITAEPSAAMNEMSEFIRDRGFISIENSAKFSDVWKIWEKLDFGSDFSLTLDTQHTFAAGIFDWKGYDRTSDFLDSLPVYPHHIHLNDSKKPWKSGIDRHEILGRGFIFSEELDGLDALLHSGCQLISETPDWNADLKFISDKFY